MCSSLGGGGRRGHAEAGALPCTGPRRPQGLGGRPQSHLPGQQGEPPPPPSLFRAASPTNLCRQAPGKHPARHCTYFGTSEDEVPTDDFEGKSRNVHIKNFNLLVQFNVRYMSVWVDYCWQPDGGASWVPSLRLQSRTKQFLAYAPSCSRWARGGSQCLEPRGCAGAAAAAGWMDGEARRGAGAQEEGRGS